jgi:hypothetical protein
MWLSVNAGPLGERWLDQSGKSSGVTSRGSQDVAQLPDSNPYLPVLPEPVVGKPVPIRSELLGVRAASGRKAWLGPRELADGAAAVALPPVVSGRLRPGALKN